MPYFWKPDQTLPVKKDNLDVDILTILMEEVFEKMRNRLIGDVTADDDVSKIQRKLVIFHLIESRKMCWCIMRPWLVAGWFRLRHYERKEA